MPRKAYKTAFIQAFKSASIGYQVALAFNKLYTAYRTRVLGDSGTIASQSLTNKAFNDLPAQDNILFAWLGVAGSKKRTSGIYCFFAKLYDMFLPANDATQTTELDQPYITGNIAPNESEGMKNPNGDGRTITIPTITVSGTYTLTKCYLDNSVGKTLVTHTEVTSGTISDITFTGSMYAYIVRNSTLTTEQKAEEATLLQSIYPEIPSVVIGTQNWATSNFEAVATPLGNVIPEVTEAVNVDKVTNGDFATGDLTGFVKIGTVNVVANVAQVNSGGYLIINSNFLKDGSWYKIDVLTSTISGSVIPTLYSMSDIYGNGLTSIKANLGKGSITYYFQSLNTNEYLGIRENQGIAGVLGLDNWSVEELGWAGSQELYTGLIAQGESVQTALEASAMWRSPNNDTALAAIYGKIFNKFSLKLLKADIDTYNAANPTAHWGYKVPTRAQLTTLSSQGGNAAKIAGTNYWLTANGTNSSGLSMIGSGYIDSNGAYQSSKGTSYLMCSDADFAREIKDGDDTFDEVAITVEGGSIRLIKD